jgi:LmbE family N-acetylglucosaminyl deacetylase
MGSLENEFFTKKSGLDMFTFDFNSAQKPLNILLLGAHCDDIEIGCGATLLRLSKEQKINHVKWVVLTSTDERKQEARASAEHFLKDIPSKEIIIYDFNDSILGENKLEVKNFLELCKKNFSPDIIFTHHRHDLHQDHSLISELTWNTFRNHLILEYEIPKYDGDLNKPNFFVTVEEEFVNLKIQALLKYYVSQHVKHWFDRETFISLMRIRGLEVASPTRYAEAFHVNKVRL